jgi:hypothetical protein
MDETLSLIAAISIGIVVFFVLVMVAAACGTVALRLAALVLGFGRLASFTAFKASLLANFVMLVLQFAAGFQFGWLFLMAQLQANGMGYGMSGRMYNPPYYEMGFGLSFTPTFYLLATMLGLVTTALIFGRMLPTDKDNRLMNFRDALTLAAVYQAFSFAMLILFGLIIFVLITLLMTI